MNPTSAKAIPENRAVPEPLALQAPAPQPVISPQPVTDLATMQAGLGNGVLAAAVTSGSLGASPGLFPFQSIYGNAAAAQAAETEEIGAETPKRRASESPATYPVAVTEVGGIGPAVAPVLPKEESVRPASTAEIPAAEGTATRPAAVPAPATKVSPAETLVTPTRTRETHPALMSPPKAEVEATAGGAAPIVVAPVRTPPEAVAVTAPMAAVPEAPLEPKSVPATTAQAGAPERVAGTNPAATTKAVAGEGIAPRAAGTTLAVVPGGAGNGPAAGTPPPPPTINTSSSEGLLQSLAGVPASSFSEALSAAQAAAPQIQTQEKVDLEASFPEVVRPTGLPRRAEKSVGAPTQLPPAAAPDMPGAGPRQGEPPETQSSNAVGPVPGSEVSIIASEPVVEQEDSGSWWDWLVSRVSNFFSRLPTNDSGLSTSAGPRPQVDLTGEADPTQNDQYQQASNAAVATQGVQADVSTTADFGENNVYPTVPMETLRASYRPTPPSSGTVGVRMPGPSVPAAASAAFDENMAPQVSEKVNDQLALYRLDQANYQQQTEETRAEGVRRIAEETERTLAEQEGMQQQARGEVDAGRARWREENRRIQEDYATQSQAKRAEIDQQISAKVQATETQSDLELTSAEGRAEAKRIAEENRATDEKRKAENQPRSWWERFKGAVSDAFAAIRKVVNDIFDALRKAVKEIIEAAKTLVRGLIEAARIAIVGIIKAFGEVIKTFVSIALVAFPDAAARAREWIDGKVNGAVDVVNQAAEALKAATDAILDWIGTTLDAALSLLQSAWNLMLDLLEVIVNIAFRALELMAQLAELMANIGPIISRIMALIEDPTPAIEAIKAYIGSLIPGIDPLAQSTALGAITFSPPPKNHWEGIWQHLKPKLSYLASNWWEVIKSTAWTLIWPFAKDDKTGERPLFKDCEEIWKLFTNDVPKDIWSGRFSKALDGILRIQQLGAAVVGMFYGWVFIALVVGGGILGAEVGVLPGMAAGAALALEIGQGLLIATLAIEGAILAKSGYNVVFQHQTPQENDEDYERISGSSLLLAIMGVLFLLGAIAARFGKAILSAAGRAVTAVVSAVLGPRAAALLEAAFNRIRAEVLAILERFRKEGKFKLRSSGIGKGTYEGPAQKLHPERFEEILNDLKRNEVKVNWMEPGEGEPWTGNYGPGGKGEPGSMRVHRDVDIRTLEHEYQHFLDDKAREFPGLRHYIENPAEMFEMEKTAYNREMDLVRANPTLSAEEKAAIIKELEAALEQERIRYKE